MITNTSKLGKKGKSKKEKENEKKYKEITSSSHHKYK